MEDEADEDDDEEESDDRDEDEEFVEEAIAEYSDSDYYLDSMI